MIRAALLVALLALSPAIAIAAGDPDVMSLGDPRAPVTVMEFGSVGCPHCAVWANDVFPDFRHKYIDTGKVRFELHEMLTGSGALAAAGFLTARCVAPDKYFQVVDDVFAQQEAIMKGGIDVLASVAAHAGLSRPQFDACLQDQKALAALSERTSKDADAHKVTGTPTFFVGDQRLEGEQTLEALDAAIAHARR
jgi:protein-disulfide isomerase